MGGGHGEPSHRHRDRASAASVAAVFALGAVVAWGLKALAIWNAGGLDRSALEPPLFVLGLILVALTYLALGAAFTAGRALWLRVVGAIVAAVVGTALLLLVEDVVSNLVPDSAGWAKEEAGLWIGSALTAALAWFAWRGRPFVGEARTP
jgi:hypothetical protein